MIYVILTIAYVLSVLISRAGMRKVLKYTRVAPVSVDVIITLVPIINVILAWLLVITYADGKGFARRYFGIKE